MTIRPLPAGAMAVLTLWCWSWRRMGMTVMEMETAATTVMATMVTVELRTEPARLSRFTTGYVKPVMMMTGRLFLLRRQLFMGSVGRAVCHLIWLGELVAEDGTSFWITCLSFNAKSQYNCCRGVTLGKQVNGDGDGPSAYKPPKEQDSGEAVAGGSAPGVPACSVRLRYPRYCTAARYLVCQTDAQFKAASKSSGAYDVIAVAHAIVWLTFALNVSALYMSGVRRM